MKLTRNGKFVVGGAVVSMMLALGIVTAELIKTSRAYDERSAQMELYKSELNDVQGQLQEYTKYKAMYECIQVERNQLQDQVEELQK